MKKSDLKAGDLLLFTPTSRLGNLIIRITGGKVSHAAIYCGEKDGKQIAVDASLTYGINSCTFEDLYEGEPTCFVFRHNNYEELCPIADIALQYASEGHPYSKLCLGLLGILLLANKFSEKTIRNEIFYKIVTLVSLKLIKIGNENILKDEKAMTCSQFAVQCYTDAGKKYDVKFDKLFIQYGAFDEPIQEKNKLSEESKISLLDIIKKEKLDLNIDKFLKSEEGLLKNENKIISDFENLLDNELLNAEKVNEVDIINSGQMLLMALCKLITNKYPTSTDEAISVISTNRNFFVSPDDLYFNSNNLTKVGSYNEK